MSWGVTPVSVCVLWCLFCLFFCAAWRNLSRLPPYRCSVRWNWSHTYGRSGSERGSRLDSSCLSSPILRHPQASISLAGFSSWWLRSRIYATRSPYRLCDRFAALWFVCTCSSLPSRRRRCGPSPPQCSSFQRTSVCALVTLPNLSPSTEVQCLTNLRVGCAYPMPRDRCRSWPKFLQRWGSSIFLCLCGESGTFEAEIVLLFE